MKKSVARKRVPRFALKPLTHTLKTTPCRPPASSCVTPTCCAAANISMAVCKGSLDFFVNPGNIRAVRKLIRDLNKLLKGRKVQSRGVLKVSRRGR